MKRTWMRAGARAGAHCTRLPLALSSCSAHGEGPPDMGSSTHSGDPQATGTRGEAVASAAAAPQRGAGGHLGAGPLPAAWESAASKCVSAALAKGKAARFQALPPKALPGRAGTWSSASYHGASVSLDRGRRLRMRLPAQACRVLSLLQPPARTRAGRQRLRSAHPGRHPPLLSPALPIAAPRPPPPPRPVSGAPPGPNAPAQDEPLRARGAPCLNRRTRRAGL